MVRCTLILLGVQKIMDRCSKQWRLFYLGVKIGDLTLFNIPVVLLLCLIIYILGKEEAIGLVYIKEVE